MKLVKTLKFALKSSFHVSILLELPEKCTRWVQNCHNSKDILTMLEAKLRLFGHILNSKLSIIDTPYFKQESTEGKGRHLSFNYQTRPQKTRNSNGRKLNCTSGFEHIVQGCKTDTIMDILQQYKNRQESWGFLGEQALIKQSRSRYIPKCSLSQLLDIIEPWIYPNWKRHGSKPNLNAHRKDDCNGVEMNSSFCHSLVADNISSLEKKKIIKTAKRKETFLMCCNS